MRVRWGFLVVAGLGLVGCLGGAGVCVAEASLPASKPLQVPEIKFEKYKLANGLEVILHEDHRLPLVSVDLWYHVGPVNERPGRTGFAHLFEHMMFEGSEHVGEKRHFKFLEGAGASDINGTTDYDRTNYFETVPSNQLELALWLESDRMGFLLETLDRAKLTNQRDVVRNELRQDEGNPYDVVDEAVGHMLFPKAHPYYANVIGSHADVEAARLADVRDFFSHYYTPNNASIAIAGDFDRAKLKALLEKYFGPIPAGPAIDAVTVTTPAITSERRGVITDTVQLPRVSVAWLTPVNFSAGNADADLFLRILGGGKSSRLYRELVYKQQIAQSVECNSESLKLASISECDIIARPNVTPEAIESAFDHEMEKLRAEGPTQAEVDRARNVLLSQKITGLQRLGGFGGVADTLDYYNQYTGDPGYFPKDVARYQAVTVGSVKQIGQQAFGKSQRVTVYGVPGKKVTEEVPRSPEDTDANVKVAPPYTSEVETQQDWRKTPPAPGPAPAFQLPVPKTFALGNGLKVYLVEDHSLPVLSAGLVTLAGSDANPAETPGLADFTARLMPEGTVERSSSDLADQVDQIGGTLNSLAQMDNASASVSALSNNTDAAFTLLSDVALHPAFKPEEVERVRGRRLTAIVQEGDDPFSSALRVGQKVLFGEQPYGYRPSGTTASLKAITREQIAGFYAAHYSPQAAALVIAGDVTEGGAHQLAERYFGRWTGSAAGGKGVPAFAAPPSRKIVIVDKPGSPQTTLLAFGFGEKRNTPQYPAMMVMNDVLGGLFSSRINMNLREKHGYTYGAFSGTFFYRYGGMFYAGAQVRTDVTSPSATELFAELNRIRSDPPSAEELKLAKDYSLQSIPGEFETVSRTAGLIGQIFVYGLPLDYYHGLPDRYRALTPGEVANVASETVHPENLIIMAVGDRAKIQPDLEKLGLGPIEVRDESGDLVAGGGK